jgi:hypothetical protein
MRYFFLIIILFFFQSCGKPRTVLICGDHICVNKQEAEQYFEENLSIEVKIIDIKKKEEISLVELNLVNNLEQEKRISIEQKNKTKNKVKILSNDEITKIKNEIKAKKRTKKIINKNTNKSTELFNNKDESFDESEKIKTKMNLNKQRKKVVDICMIIKKCNIDEISKYLLDQGKKKDFPDITKRK